MLTNQINDQIDDIITNELVGLISEVVSVLNKEDGMYAIIDSSIYDEETDESQPLFYVFKFVISNNEVVHHEIIKSTDGYDSFDKAEEVLYENV